jgi:hypothetical protein
MLYVQLNNEHIKLRVREMKDQSIIYQIRIRGHLGHQWAEWFDGMTVTPEEDGTTLMTGPVIDDAALYGLLKKVRDSGVQLLSVNPLGDDNTKSESDE